MNLSRFHQRMRLSALTTVVCLLAGLPVDSRAQVAADGTVDLLTTPPELTTSVSPNVVLTFDDSGSMGRNYMPDSRPYGGGGWGATDQQSTAGSQAYNSGGRPFLCAGIIDPRITDPMDPRSWAMNGVYYNPNAKYDPPLRADGVTAFPNATYTAAWDNGIIVNRPDSPETSSTRNLSTGTRFCGNAAGYYRYRNTAPALTLDENGNISNTTDLFNTSNWEWVALPTGERQNFANWYSYYHTRYMASVTAVSRAYAKFDRNLRTAWQNINNRRISATTAIYAFEDDAAVNNTRTQFYQWLFSTPVGGNTPNQAAADRVGQFFQRAGGDVDTNPYWDRTLDRELENIKEAKTFKYEVPLESEQGGSVTVEGRDAVMLASNNYLGLSNHPRVKQAAHRGLDEWGYGMASVRFLCGTEPIHLELERAIARFVGCEAAILHSSCFAANEAFFAALLGNDFGQSDYQDVIYSDQLNHASIIDGVRLVLQGRADESKSGSDQKRARRETIH